MRRDIVQIEQPFRMLNPNDGTDKYNPRMMGAFRMLNPNDGMEKCKPSMMGHSAC